MHTGGVWVAYPGALRSARLLCARRIAQQSNPRAEYATVYDYLQEFRLHVTPRQWHEIQKAMRKLFFICFSQEWS